MSGKGGGVGRWYSLTLGKKCIIPTFAQNPSMANLILKSMLFLFATFFLSFKLGAQGSPNDWMRAGGSLDGFRAGQQYYTMVTDANFREKPDINSNVMAKLAIGTPVKVLEVAEESYTLRGAKLPWVKVSVEKTGSGPMEGYIWGGFLALAYIQTPDEEYLPNRGVLYLTGVAAYDTAKYELTVQVRAAKDGKELAKAEFTTTGDLSYYPSFEVDYSPFKGVSNLISVNYYYPACGYASGNNLLFWKESGELVKVLETSSVGDAGVYYSTSAWILPTDNGGIGDHILVVKDESEFEENDDDYVRTRQEYAVTLYKWTGKKLVKVKHWK